MEEQFVYTQLDVSHTDSFRILELQPGAKEAPIVCNLIHARLDVGRQPAYEAISYVWGSTDRPIPIYCDGKRMYITENLKNALVRVRLPDRPRSVWADSVCIDQDNLDEKGHQVQFMGKIYSNASRVLICLGDDDEGHAQKAMSLVKDVSGMIAKTLPECDQTYDSFPYFAPDDPLFQDDRWPAYKSLLCRHWYRRGWVLQEAALAKDAVVLWGDAECNWMPIMETEIWVQVRAQTLQSRFNFDDSTHALLHATMGPYGMRLRPLLWANSNVASESRLFVPTFMAAARTLILSNPADRVFAFLAILDKISQSELNIKADYSKTPQSVYLDFAVAYLEATRDLNLLQYVQHTNESIEFGTPSWVPLWNIDECNSILVKTPGNPRDFPAKFALERRSSTPRLTVQAFLFDTVQFASGPLLIKTVEDVAQLWKIIRRVDESADVNEFLQVMCWGAAKGELEPWELQFSAYGRHLIASSSTKNLGRKDFDPAPMTRPQNIDWLNEDFPHVRRCILTCTRGRRFVIAKNGYYGLIPAVAKQSDICAFLPGAKPAFALRQTENVREYKILGDAYFSTGEIVYQGDNTVYGDITSPTFIAKISSKEQTITLV